MHSGEAGCHVPGEASPISAGFPFQLSYLVPTSLQERERSPRDTRVPCHHTGPAEMDGHLGVFKIEI